MPIVHRYDPPERFVAGTVGEPGSRTFFLQARAGERVTSVALEKQQVAVLAERLESLLDELMEATGGAVVPAVAPPALDDPRPLEQPLQEEFRAGTMTLAWDENAGRVVLEVFPIEEQEAGAPASDDVADPASPDVEPREVLLVTLDPAPARAFCKRALAVVAAGRPPCQFCGGPLDPDGHLCPRANGFRRRAPGTA